jgi:hypothetical protein
MKCGLGVGIEVKGLQDGFETLLDMDCTSMC